MTLHKLSAGSGYEYLTRQVAALDSTEKGAIPLADYYSAKGESPGRWVGSGLVGVDGLETGDVVTVEQIKHLFGTGSHPLTADPLGAAYKVYDNTGVDGFNAEVARRVRASTGSTTEGGSTDGEPPYDVVARVRSEVARERFVAAHGREPKTARELSDALARYSRPRQTAVAGFDLTFSPVKSVSALWAVATVEVARAIEEAHGAAVRDALAFIERGALFTREGRNGARQVETRGLVATVFTHRDSRAGDPDLHAHVAVANKVQTRSGKWLSIYGTVLHEHVVAASESYNTALERRLVEALGVVFVERPGGARDKRAVREIDGVPADLCERWSERRKAITARQRELAREFKRAHGRPPTPVEAVALAQQANLETREAKHEPRSEAEQRATWRAEAVEVLGSARSPYRLNGWPRSSSGSSTTRSAGCRSTSPPTSTRSPSPPGCVVRTAPASTGTPAGTTTPATACWRPSSASSHLRAGTTGWRGRPMRSSCRCLLPCSRAYGSSVARRCCW
ncbi:MobF family relaxase [Nocardioides donggukensis]|uniref:MobF family relaxase n=1 Tax=Nocardioides donggukensis TaxID=2774019 RepID=UPI001CE16CE4|nr:MobF family relaxase [Nocardioides donggukensis]